LNGRFFEHRQLTTALKGLLMGRVTFASPDRWPQPLT